jgi:hypothetical protein
MSMPQNAARLDAPVEMIPNGPGAAAILAAGIGCAAIGVLAFAAELSPGLRGLLNFYNPVGPLSGKTTVTIIIWLAAWYGLWRLWRTKTVDMGAVSVAAFILLGLGFLLTFPPFWYLFV